jgi:hypothetical protein
VEGATEHLPVPESHPASAALCHCLIFPEAIVLSLTHNWYQVAADTAFQTYEGVLVDMAPEGDTSVAFPGMALPLETMNESGALHAP